MGLVPDFHLLKDPALMATASGEISNPCACLPTPMQLRRGRVLDLGLSDKALLKRLNDLPGHP